MTDQEQINQEEIDLRQILKVIIKYKALIAAITLFALLTSGVLSYFVLSPVYESKVTLMVAIATDKTTNINNNNGDNLENLINNISRIPTLTMNTYVNQLKSQILLQRVQDRLNLDPQVYSLSTLSGIIGATAIKDSNLIEITVSHNDPMMASKIAKTLSEQYLALISENNQSNMTRSVGFLEDQRINVEKELDQVLAQLKQFDSQPYGVEFLQQQFSSKNQDLSKYQSLLNDVQVDLTSSLAGVEQSGEILKSTPGTINVKVEGNPGSVTQEVNPVYQQLSQDYAQKMAKVAEDRAGLQTIGGIIAGIQGDINSIQKDLAEKKDQRDRLEAERKRLADARELLANKVTETQIARSVDLGNTSLTVVSPAIVPSTPVKPNKQLNMAIALVLGLMLAVMAAFLLEFMDNTVKNSKDLADKLGVPHLGSIPGVSGKRR